MVHTGSVETHAHYNTKLNFVQQVVLGYNGDPAINLAGSYTANGVPGALDPSYNAGLAFYNLTM